MFVQSHLHMFCTSCITALSYVAHALLPWRWLRANSKIVKAKKEPK